MENKNTFKGRLKSDICSMSWWYGALGSVLSTVVGIALTFGVSTWVSYRHDKQEAREMMFNVIKTARDNKEEVLQLDSVYNNAQKAIKKLFEYYDATDGDFAKMNQDTLLHYYYRLTDPERIVVTRSKTESYFYSAETMHQFDNPEIYSEFATYVEFDRNVYEKIEKLNLQAFDMEVLINSKCRCEKKTYAQAISEVIKDHSLYRYWANLDVAYLGFDIEQYDKWYHKMMAAMGATEEELAKYDKKNEKATLTSKTP